MRGGAEWESIMFSASRPGLIPSRGKTTPSAERQQREWASPLTPATGCEHPLCSNPTLTSIPVDSCVKPPSFHSSPLHRLNCSPSADALRKETGRREAAHIVAVQARVLLFRLTGPDCQRRGRGGAACPARVQKTCATQCEESHTALESKTCCTTLLQHSKLHSENQEAFSPPLWLFNLLLHVSLKSILFVVILLALAFITQLQIQLTPTNNANYNFYIFTVKKLDFYTVICLILIIKRCE